MNAHAVVDASVATKWLVEEVDTETATALSSAWERNNVTPVAPFLLPFGVANVLY